MEYWKKIELIRDACHEVRNSKFDKIGCKFTNNELISDLALHPTRGPVENYNMRLFSSFVRLLRNKLGHYRDGVSVPEYIKVCISIYVSKSESCVYLISS